ncbi:hypothetical protein M378DRAFT_969685 [Amanita muscaria Koide BX008]|uniref:Protein kinase domain-containing protein n=1 Tax=Amanita muscaria (strain Koide BX008) TaxID=946122 RepID=A0A0C2WEL9_AMAMK|nr:hypothetical protein M378DRAFT_969685 [Amanita muscaria Koide BX008]
MQQPRQAFDFCIVLLALLFSLPLLVQPLFSISLGPFTLTISVFLDAFVVPTFLDPLSRQVSLLLLALNILSHRSEHSFEFLASLDSLASVILIFSVLLDVFAFHAFLCSWSRPSRQVGLLLGLASAFLDLAHQLCTSFAVCASLGAGVPLPFPTRSFVAITFAFAVLRVVNTHVPTSLVLLAPRTTLAALSALLAAEHYLLSLPSQPSPFAQRDWPSDPTVLAPKQYPLLFSPLTERDLPPDLNLYKAYLCPVFGIKSADVLDFTGHIDRTRFIAAGGSGEVWEASWKGFNKNLIRTPKALPKVVVKLVRLPPFRDEVHKNKRFKRMKRELLLWSKLNHPHILPLIGIACIEGDANLPALISPWMENGNIMEYLQQNPSLPASKLLKEIIKGLRYLHTFDPVIVHGDLKGANVLINHRKEACLCDFGLSRFVVDNTLWRTTATHASGTLRWMAPELIQDDIIVPTTATDIYAFGMTSYEILSRGSPFAATNDIAVMKKVTDGQRPAKIESCHSDEIWSIITRCWAHEPEDRPSTEETLKLVLQHNTPSNL